MHTATLVNMYKHIYWYKWLYIFIKHRFMFAQVGKIQTEIPKSTFNEKGFKITLSMPILDFFAISLICIQIFSQKKEICLL